MSMNIKNPETHRLAARLAKLTGETLTEAVTQALREKLARMKLDTFDQKKFDALIRIAHDCAKRLSPEAKKLDIDDLLYDERGFPK